MSTDQLHRAAKTMRREDDDFFDALADLLDDVVRDLEVTARPGSEVTRPVPAGLLRHVEVVAAAYLADPGDLPAGAV